MKRSSSSSSSKPAKVDDNGESELQLGENTINLQKVKQPYLSGAYIRSFVKQLASSRTKLLDPHMTMREKGTKPLERETAMNPPPPPPPQKKQVRRRLHTRKPYQEKLLNMAEARREIVTALKLHRAAMKQARPDSLSRPDFPTEGLAARDAGNSPGFCSAYSWSAPPPPVFHESLDFVLPSQTLGLNLNLQDFIAAPCSVFSASSPSTSSSSPPPSAAYEEIPAGLCKSAMGMGDEDEELVSSPFDEVMEFPAWLNANESCLQHVNDFCNFQDPALPCMEIEEIEAMDGDWLA